MSESMTLAMTAQVAGNNLGGTGTSYTSGSLVSINDTIADSVTDGLHALVLDVTQVKALFIVSDQAITLEFNNATTGVPTIVLKANVPYLWSTDSYDSLILTADVTALYITNASGSTANVKLYAIVDPTV